MRIFKCACQRNTAILQVSDFKYSMYDVTRCACDVCTSKTRLTCVSATNKQHGTTCLYEVEVIEFGLKACGDLRLGTR